MPLFENDYTTKCRWCHRYFADEFLDRDTELCLDCVPVNDKDYAEAVRELGDYD